VALADLKLAVPTAPRLAPQPAPQPEGKPLNNGGRTLGELAGKIRKVFESTSQVSQDVGPLDLDPLDLDIVPLDAKYFKEGSGKSSNADEEVDLWGIAEAPPNTPVASTEDDQIEQVRLTLARSSVFETPQQATQSHEK
jgi:hypothetical protein